jgi:hypothetical protein
MNKEPDQAHVNGTRSEDLDLSTESLGEDLDEIDIAILDAEGPLPAGANASQEAIQRIRRVVGAMRITVAGMRSNAREASKRPTAASDAGPRLGQEVLSCYRDAKAKVVDAIGDLQLILSSDDRCQYDEQLQDVRDTLGGALVELDCIRMLAHAPMVQ